MKYIYNYENYHKHCSDTNIIIPDSTVLIEEYVARAIQLGHKSLSTVEHGWQGRYHLDSEKAEENGLKFIFGTEAYWVKNRFESDGSNNHIIILAKNEKGRRAINLALSEANETGYYRQARLDLDLILNLPEEDVFITSACVGFWKYGYAETDQIVKLLHEKFKNNFMLEVQYHWTEKQKELNRHILELSNKLGIDIIMGCDSHYIYDYQHEDRNELLVSKQIFYEEENGWFLDYPSGEEAYERFQKQGILNDAQILRAMQNTLKVLEFENITFNKEIKLPTIYPLLTQKGKDEKLKQIIYKEWSTMLPYIEKEKIAEYQEGILYEYKIIVDTKMTDYFLLDYEIIKRGKAKGGLISFTARGSGGSFYINTLLGFSNLDRFRSPVTLYPDRFMSATRILESKSLPDIDFNIYNVEHFVEAQRELLGENSVFPMIAYGTLKTKSAFKMYARAKKLNPDLANEISQQIEKYEQDYNRADDDNKDLIDILDYIDKKYHPIFEESKKYRGILSDKKVHPCAYLLFNGNIKEELGIMKIKNSQSKKEILVTVTDGYVAETYKYLKNDFLNVEVVHIINEVYKKIGRKQHTINELQQILQDPNCKAWDIYEKGITKCVNQFESKFAIDCAKQYKPKTIAETTALISALRPGFKSLLQKFLSREKYSTGVKRLDELLQDSFHYMMYQENIMTFLTWLSIMPSETYSIIKKISKKKFKAKELEELKNKLKKSWIKINGSLDYFEETWQVVEDSSKYSFNASHAYSYAFDSLYCAYLKAYYPYEFYSTVLEIYTFKKEKDRVSDIVQEMESHFGIKLGEFKFGNDNRSFTIDKENKTIHPSLASIKRLSQDSADELYELGKNEYISFTDLLIDICENTKSINKTKINILIKLNYFSQFGKNKKLLAIYEEFQKKYKKTHKDKTKIARIDYMKDFEDKTSNMSIGAKEQIQAEIEALEHPISKYPIMPSNVYAVIEDLTKNNGTPKFKCYGLKYGDIIDLKCYKKDYNNQKFLQYNIINIIKTQDKKKRKKVNDDWIFTDETEKILTQYDILK